MGQLKGTIVESGIYDPWSNLAIEELLLANTRQNEVVLYLWQNQNTVVIGRNQNAWRECKTKLLEAENGKIARRLSGGGAVYHDLGNLNFTFLADKSLYDIHRQLKVILNALRHLDIDAEFSGRNDLLAQGRKFSGNAFYYGKEASLHHGTLLFNVDMSSLGRYLQPSTLKLKAKGVKSVSSRVVNLKEINADLTLDQLKGAVKEAFVQEYQLKPRIMSLDDLYKVPSYEKLYNKYASWDWLFGKTPSFDVVKEHRFTWGEVQVGLSVDAGQVKEAKVYTDAMDADLFESLGDIFIGLQFDFSIMANALREAYAGKNVEIVDEVADWLQEN